MIEACIFDIGGVLIKTDEAILYAVENSLKANNLEMPQTSDIAPYFGVSSRTIIKMAVASVYKGSDADAVAEKCYTRFQNLYPEKVLDKHKLFPETENCLRGLYARGIKTACQTGKNEQEARMVLGHFNLLGYFPVIVTVDDVKKPRPDPEAMYLALKKLGIRDKNKCLYIGDTVVDIKFAKNAGVKIACVTTGLQPREILVKEKPDYIISKITEILTVL
jgi:HAD superfamily hydrolase (TIGR01509 family)